MTQLLREAAHNFSAFSHERQARAQGKESWGVQHITQGRFRDARPLNSQELPGQPRTLPTIEKDSRSRMSDVYNPWIVHTNLTTAFWSSPGTDWLKDAIAELESIDDEVTEEALPEIQAHTKDKARVIISALATQSVAPTVYPTADGEVALHFKSPVATSSVLILVRNDGQAACFSYIDGKNRRARYEDAAELPDEFVKAQLRLLEVPAFSKDT